LPSHYSSMEQMLCYVMSVASSTRSTTTFCCQSWRGNSASTASHTMVSVLSTGPVSDVHGKRKNSPCRDCSVPQGTCLGPVKLITYTESVASVFGSPNSNCSLTISRRPEHSSTQLKGIDDVRGLLCDCTTNISNWCAARRLQLNENKTELAWFGKCSRLNKLVNMEQTMTVGASVLQTAAAARDLGVLLDQELSMTTHRESDVIMPLPTASTPSDTSSSRTGTRRSAGALVG